MLVLTSRGEPSPAGLQFTSQKKNVWKRRWKNAEQEAAIAWCVQALLLGYSVFRQISAGCGTGSSIEAEKEKEQSDE